MIRQLFLLHRYLGIAVGVLMVMWCLSGVVMMYVGYPRLQEDARVKHLPPLTWDRCCKIGDDFLADSDPVEDFRIEMLGGHPVLQLRNQRQRRLIDLDTGTPVGPISEARARTVAQGFARNSAAAEPRLRSRIDYDQWTVSGEFKLDRPLYRFGLDDAAGTEIYISSSTGQAVQITTGGERFWNWLGAVPHWLYFAELRRNPSAWTDVVIVTSLLGCFLVIIGIYIGLLQLVRRPIGRLSPYSGLNLWHHVAGLVFGAFTLAWVVSGLLSVNPWGWLEGEGAQHERAALRGGEDFLGREVKQAVVALAHANLGSVVSVESSPLHGQIYLIVTTVDGVQRRVDANASLAPLGNADRGYFVHALAGAGDAALAELLTREDFYYFAHHGDPAPLPVYRIILSDKSATRYYVDAISGEILAKMDPGARGYRWLQQGLHRMDFIPWLRERPAWDMMMLILLSGVTTVCVTGSYLGLKRLLS